MEWNSFGNILYIYVYDNFYFNNTGDDCVMVPLWCTDLPTGRTDHLLMAEVTFVTYQHHFHITNALVNITYPLLNILECFLKPMHTVKVAHQYRLLPHDYYCYEITMID